MVTLYVQVSAVSVGDNEGPGVALNSAEEAHVSCLYSMSSPTCHVSMLCCGCSGSASHANCRACCSALECAPSPCGFGCLRSRCERRACRCRAGVALRDLAAAAAAATAILSAVVGAGAGCVVCMVRMHTGVLQGVDVAGPCSCCENVVQRSTSRYRWIEVFEIC